MWGHFCVELCLWDGRSLVWVGTVSSLPVSNATMWILAQLFSQQLFGCKILYRLKRGSYPSSSLQRYLMAIFSFLILQERIT